MKAGMNTPHRSYLHWLQMSEAMGHYIALWLLVHWPLMGRLLHLDSRWASVDEYLA